MGGVLVKAVSDVPLVVGSDGTVFVNMTQYEGVQDPQRLLEMALADAGELFIGVSLDSLELEDVLERLSHGTAEAAAYVLGARIRDRRTKDDHQ